MLGIRKFPKSNPVSAILVWNFDLFVGITNRIAIDMAKHFYSFLQDLLQATSRKMSVP